MRVIRFALPMAATAVALVAGVARAAPPPPDLKLFAADPAISDVSIAPDGKTVAYLEVTPQGRRIALLPAGTGLPRFVETGQSDVSQLQWIDSDHLLVFVRQVFEALPVLPRQTVTQGVIYNLKTRKFVTVLAGMERVVPILAGGPIGTGQVGGRTMLFVRGLVFGPAFNLFRVDPDTGRGVRMALDTLDGDSWVVDAHGKVLAEVVHKSAHEPLVLRVRDGARWRDVDVNGRLFRLVGLGRAPGTALLSLDDGLHEVGSDAVIGPPLQPPGTQVTQVLTNWSTQQVEGLVLSGSQAAPIFYDAALEAAWARTARAFLGQRLVLVGHSADATQIVLSASRPGAPHAFYWVDLRTGKGELIADSQPGLARLGLAPIEGFDFTARDGLTLKARIYRPPGPVVPRLPVVVVPATSDWAEVGTYPRIEAIASRGYAVLEVAARGAIGIGEAARIAGDGQLARGQLTDLSDALAAAASRGAVDPARACILGGYAALASVTVQHAGYRCAIGIEPTVDLRRHVATPDGDVRGEMWRDVQAARRALGADAAEPGLTRASPLAHAADATAPVLLVQEADDALDQVQETERMRSALARAKRPVEMLTLKAKTESLSTPAGREAMYAAILAFLAKYNPV